MTSSGAGIIMKISTFIYSLKQGLKNILRNSMFSLASIATMSACIFMFGLFFSLIMNFQNVVKEAEKGISVNVFFQEGSSEEQIRYIGEQIRKRAEVSNMEYVTAEEAWENFKEDYFGDAAAEVAEDFQDNNPLVESAHYVVYLNDVAMQPALVTYIESIGGVREVVRSEATARALSDFNILIGYISAAVIIILLGVAVFLISNTVTVGISIRREEIAIMKLIGATDFFVRAPFIVEGILIGIIGTLIPLLLLYFLYNRVLSYIADRFQILLELLKFIPVGQVFAFLVPIALAMGVGIGFLGSYITVRRHLDV